VGIRFSLSQQCALIVIKASSTVGRINNSTTSKSREATHGAALAIVFAWRYKLEVDQQRRLGAWLELSASKGMVGGLSFL